MSTVAAMAEQVHREERYADEHPEPVSHEPLHGRRPSNLSSYIVVYPSDLRVCLDRTAPGMFTADAQLVASCSTHIFSASFGGVHSFSDFPMS